MRERERERDCILTTINDYTNKQIYIQNQHLKSV